jgi:Mor family transcriptional regulator
MAGPSLNLWKAVVYFERQHEKLTSIASFDDLICKIQNVQRWKKTLRYSDFSLCGVFGKDDLCDITNDASMAAVPVSTANGERKIIVKLKSREFSKFKSLEEEALSSIGALFHKLDYIP